MTGVSLGGFLAQIAEGVAEHPPRMRRPPSKASDRAVFAIQLEMLLRPTPPTALVDWPGSALGDSLLGTSAAGIEHLYLSPTLDAEKGVPDRRLDGTVWHPRAKRFCGLGRWRPPKDQNHVVTRSGLRFGPDERGERFRDRLRCRRDEHPGLRASVIARTESTEGDDPAFRRSDRRV